MKKIFGLLAIFAFVLTSCTGDQGPIGPQGPEGPPGTNGDGAALPSVFGETVTYDYNANDNNWVSPTLTYDNTVDGDIFLVYLSVGDGVFSPMPISFFDDQGTFQYEFNHDASSVQLTIEGNNDLSNLSANRTDNVKVRVAVIPAALAKDFSKSDFANFKAMINAFDIKEKDIKSINR